MDTPTVAPPQPQTTPTPVSPQRSPLPPDLSGFNWAAFLWSWIWAVSNKIWIGLLVFLPVPGISLGVQVLLGIYGNKWAWKNREWTSIEEFKRVQRKWIKWYFILLLPVTLIFLGLMFLLMKNSLDPRPLMNEIEQTPHDSINFEI